MSATRLRSATISAICLVLGWSAVASAQTYPSKPIHLVVPVAPGGITDVLARALGQKLTEAWGQQVVIENKPAGAGQVGTDSVAKAAPDGHTLLVAADATFVTSPHTYSKLPYDPINDFAPITGLGISPQALVVNPKVPVRTLAELIELARKKPGEITYGTFGIGTSGHLNIVLLESMTGTKFTPVHYRGATPGLTDTIAGHIQMMIVSIGLVAQPWQAGQLKVLGFGSSARLAAISRRADLGGKRSARLPGRLVVRLGGAQGHSARCRRQAQCASPTHLQRAGLSRPLPHAQLHLFDRELAGDFRRAHASSTRRSGARSSGMRR